MTYSVKWTYFATGYEIKIEWNKSYLELLNWMVKFSTYLIESNAPEPTWNKRDRIDELFESLDLPFSGQK